ncbi:hypothetical protein G5B39_15180 (plasmid) [Rhodobacteraceae bacterium SC52]|nr:hypothetical protein G5B39_15180 [Rhodobacteraceae bacterium SC52]
MEAQSRAEREALSENCAGADAFIAIKDPISGEVGAPTFLVRLGNVPESGYFQNPEPKKDETWQYTSFNANVPKKRAFE